MQPPRGLIIFERQKTEEDLNLTWGFIDRYLQDACDSMISRGFIKKPISDGNKKND